MKRKVLRVKGVGQNELETSPNINPIKSDVNIETIENIPLHISDNNKKYDNNMLSLFSHEPTFSHFGKSVIHIVDIKCLGFILEPLLFLLKNISKDKDKITLGRSSSSSLRSEPSSPSSCFSRTSSSGGGNSV